MAFDPDAAYLAFDKRGSRPVPAATSDAAVSRCLHLRSFRARPLPRF
jgi:hypothetical protein